MADCGIWRTAKAFRDIQTGQAFERAQQGGNVTPGKIGGRSRPGRAPAAGGAGKAQAQVAAQRVTDQDKRGADRAEPASQSSMTVKKESLE